MKTLRFSVFRAQARKDVPMLSCAVFRSTVPSARLLFLTISINHTRQVIAEVWWFRVTAGGVCSDWCEFYGCHRRDGNGNNVHWRRLLRKKAGAENYMYTKGTWSAIGSNTTIWIVGLIYLVHNLVRNLICLMIFVVKWTVFIRR